MPTGFATLDTGFPNLKAMDNTDQQIKAVEDYLVQLLENLRYMLRNIGPDNLNTTEMVQWLGETISEPIKIAIQDIEEQIYTQIDITAKGITSTVAAAQDKYDAGNIVISLFGYGAPTVSAGAHSGEVYLDQSTGYYYTSNGTTWTKSGTTLPMKSSELKQTADEIKAQVTDSNGNYTVMNLKSDALYIGNGSTAVKISGGNLTDGTVGTTQIGTNAVTTGKIAANAITSTEIAADAVTTAKIAANAVTANEINAGAVSTDKLAANAVTTAKLASEAVTANEIKAGAVSTDKLAANAVTAAKIAANTITASQIAANTITASQIAANTITSSQIAANTITGNEIAAGTITAAKLSANALNGYDIYGAEYHDPEGDSTLNIDSFTGFTALMYGSNNMTSIANSAFGIVKYEGYNTGQMYLSGVHILNASGSAAIPQCVWQFGNYGIAVPFGYSDPGNNTPGRGVTGALYFKLET